MLRVFLGLVALWILALGSFGRGALAQNTLRLDELNRFLPVWRYHEGDDSLWAQPEYPTDDWEPLVQTEFWEDRPPERGWFGIGWFRTKITVDNEAAGFPIAYMLALRGAAELYVDGELTASFGRVGTSAESEDPVVHHSPTMRPGVLVFDEGDHVLAVRVSNFYMNETTPVGLPLGGFNLRLGTLREANAAARHAVRRITADQFLFTGIPAAFGIVFLLLFVFYRAHTEHLWFALFSLLGAAVVFLDLQSEIVYDGFEYVASRRMLHVLVALNAVVAMPTTYRLLGSPPPLHSWGLIGVGLILAVWSWVDPFGAFRFLPLFSLLVVGELVRAAVASILKKQQRAWIIGVGLVLLGMGVAYDGLLDLGIIYPLAGTTNGYYYGMTMLELSMAVSLALAFAQTNRRLEHKLVEVKELSERTLNQEREARRREIEQTRLEAENLRRAVELRKAEQLKESYEALERAHQKLKATQANLVHSEKMASLGRLAAGIAHEIKNPLNFVNNFAKVTVDMATELRNELAADHRAADADQLELVNTILENAQRIHDHGERADAVVRSMMRHSETSSDERRRVDVNALVDTYLNLAYRAFRARESQIEVAIERNFDPAVGSHELRPESFSRALLNILDNAFEAAMTERDNPDHVPKVSISTSRLEDSILIRIEDNGPGVPPEIRERVFEPFFTTKPTGSGTGLGLSLAHEIITNGHGGRLGLEELVEDVTAFYITIPTD